MSPEVESDDDVMRVCERVFIAFCRHRDRRDAARIAEVTDPDCVWERAGKPYVGRDAVIAGVFELPETIIVRHILTNIAIARTGDDTAEGIASYMVYRDDGLDDATLPRRLTGPVRVGDYVARFRRTPEGWQVCYAAAQRLFERRD